MAAPIRWICKVFKMIWQYRSLIFELAKREFASKFQGSAGGILWSFIQPIFLLSVYTLAFGVILKTRWGFEGSTMEYALMLFSGLLIFNAIAECLQKAPMLIVSNPSFVKKVVFPLEILSVVTVISVLVQLLIGVGVWLLGYICIYGVPHLSIVYFPLVLVCFVPVLLGVTLLLSGAGVVLRDIAQMTGMCSHVLLFLTPIFYSIHAAPVVVQRLLCLNPLTFLVEMTRNILFYGLLPSMSYTIVYFLGACFFAYSALYAFRSARYYFADMV